MSVPHMPMMNDEGLLECPFCGSSDVYMEDEMILSKATCHGCGASGGEWVSRSLSVKSWNTRNGHPYTADDLKQSAQERE